MKPELVSTTIAEIAERTYKNGQYGPREASKIAAKYFFAEIVLEEYENRGCSLISQDKVGKMLDCATHAAVSLVASDDKDDIQLLEDMIDEYNGSGFGRTIRQIWKLFKTDLNADIFHTVR